MADTYTHKDLARLCGVSETTIKSYRRKFPGFIPVLTRGKPIRFKGDAGEVCLKIRDCFAKGMSVNETRKVLKENFKENPPVRRARSAAPPAGDAASGGITQEYMEKFFETAGQMMQGMAGLATAQAKAEQRLRKVESVLTRLLEADATNREAMAVLLAQHPGESRQTEPVNSFTPPSEPEQRVRARKIVNVHSPEGAVESYALEKEEAEAVEFTSPPDAFLNTPIVIRNDQGEFLGVPGRLPLSGFLEILVREAEENGSSLSSWAREGEAWVYTIRSPGRDSHSLHFSTTTTPRGNLVVLFDRLDVNDRQTSPQFLQEFFRQVKDKV
ncbi:helix-turn-helix domain-containing protein [Pseudodesulfovibrio portus]|uniref:MerR family transcriptional regulator n=1 Tax=Pseudodesulfovibrio portus TaxID=231439 RepID=A0ABN6RXF7_9BACT|nr:helix-turn-helix domain-containing protein [Pseudodesulfovibrio portus]BDQ34323.1 MerR family transcriptional regulator [Pseudodesulfovibrio portus]